MTLPTWENPVWHRRWRIHSDTGLAPFRFAFVHDDFDGEENGDRRGGYADTIDEAKARIDEMEGDAA